MPTLRLWNEQPTEFKFEAVETTEVEAGEVEPTEVQTAKPGGIETCIERTWIRFPAELRQRQKPAEVDREVLRIPRQRQVQVAAKFRKRQQRIREPGPHPAEEVEVISQVARRPALPLNDEIIERPDKRLQATKGTKTRQIKQGDLKTSNEITAKISETERRPLSIPTAVIVGWPTKQIAEIKLGQIAKDLDEPEDVTQRNIDPGNFKVPEAGTLEIPDKKVEHCRQVVERKVAQTSEHATELFTRLNRERPALGIEIGIELQVGNQRGIRHVDSGTEADIPAIVEVVSRKVDVERLFKHLRCHPQLKDTVERRGRHAVVHQVGNAGVACIKPGIHLREVDAAVVGCPGARINKIESQTRTALYRPAVDRQRQRPEGCPAFKTTLNGKRERTDFPFLHVEPVPQRKALERRALNLAVSGWSNKQAESNRGERSLHRGGVSDRHIHARPGDAEGGIR